MLGNFHQLAPAMAGVMGVATVLADTGYLERSGPLPLRFREPSAPIVRHIDAAFPPPFLPPYFPPPNMITMPTTVTPSASPDTSQATNDPPAPIALTNEPPSEFVAKQLVDDPGVAIGADGVVSPRMLLKYFAKSTNGAPKESGIPALWA